MDFVSFKTWLLIVCDTGIYAIINESFICAFHKKQSNVLPWLFMACVLHAGRFSRIILANNSRKLLWKSSGEKTIINHKAQKSRQQDYVCTISKNFQYKLHYVEKSKSRGQTL